MNRRLNLFKDKLPKRKRRASDDDDVYVRGMFNPFLDTTGYDVEVIQEEGKTTAEKGVLADYPDFEGIGWIFDSEVKAYEALLKERRDKMTHTFRYMLKQNSMTSSSEPSPPSSMPSGLPNNVSRSSSSQSSQPQQRSQIMDDVRRLREFFSFGGGADEDEEEEENEEAQASTKNNPTPPQSSSSSSSSRRSSNPALPVYQTVTPPESVQSSRPHSVRSSPPHSVHSSRRSSNSARPSTILSSSGSVASTIDYGFNQ